MNNLDEKTKDLEAFKRVSIVLTQSQFYGAAARRVAYTIEMIDQLKQAIQFEVNELSKETKDEE